MTMANTIFPLLPAKNLFYVLIRIFQHVNEFEDIHLYRLVSRGWRNFIDQILNSPILRKEFLQHPLSIPANQRKPLVRARLCDDLPGRRPGSHCRHVVCDRGRYVLISTTTDDETGTQHMNIFAKTNAALKFVGRVELAERVNRQLDKVFAMCQDDLLQLTRKTSVDVNNNSFPPARQLWSFKRQGKQWSKFLHPAYAHCEQDGVEILGLRQMSETEVFLLLFYIDARHLKVLNLCDGTVQLSTHYRLTYQDLVDNRSNAGEGTSRSILDMDTFGLVISSDGQFLTHFSFLSQEQNWQVDWPSEGKHQEIIKTREVTIVHLWSRCEVIILDNTCGATKNVLSYQGFPGFLHNIVPIGRYLVFQGFHLPPSQSLLVFDLRSNQLKFHPIQLRDAIWDASCLINIISVAKQSETTVLFVITSCQHFPIEDGDIFHCEYVVRLELTSPWRITKLQLLDNSKRDETIISTVPCSHGFFAVGHQLRTSSTNSLFSLKF